MNCSFDGTTKLGALLNWLFWLPFLFMDAGDHCGHEYSFASCIFVALGTALPLASFAIIYRFDLKLILGGFCLHGLLFGFLTALLIYLLIGLMAHFSIKSVWGSGIL